MSTIKVTITRPVAGAFNLGIHVGESCELPTEQAKELMDKGYAKPCEESPATPIIDEPAAEEKKEEPKEEKPVVETASLGLNKKEKKGK